MGEWDIHYACVKQESDKKFLLENLTIRDQLGDLGVFGRILLKLILKDCEDLYWTELTQRTVQWRGFMKTATFGFGKSGQHFGQINN